MKKQFLVLFTAVFAVASGFAQPDNMVRIDGGTFSMGSPASEAGRNDNEPQHQVTLSTFYMSKYEVTQMEWQAVMGKNPGKPKGANYPVSGISWMDALQYCNKRSEKEGLTPVYTISKLVNVSWNRSANGYRLPTEAEWEYACRAGNAGPFYTGSDLTASQANFNGKGIMDVGSFEPNAFGLYDMYGNVWEWCWDFFGEYNLSPSSNPIGASSGLLHIYRGGAWNTANTSLLRSASRSSNQALYKTDVLGLRVVRSGL